MPAAAAQRVTLVPGAIFRQPGQRVRAALLELNHRWHAGCLTGTQATESRIYWATDPSSKSIHGFTLSPRAMPAILLSDTLRSERSTPLR
jgi:hypothetical protein